MIRSFTKDGFCLYFSLLIFIAGCATESATVPHPQVSVTADEQSLLNAFYEGKASLITPGWIAGASVAISYGQTVPERRRYYNQGDWKALALSTLKAKFGDDLAWFYLGRAAEELGNLCSAIKYFETSIERSESFLSSCLGHVCSGFTFPDDSQAGMKRIKGRINVDRECNALSK